MLFTLVTLRIEVSIDLNVTLIIAEKSIKKNIPRLLKDVRAHCYCTSLVRTLFIGHARATSFSSAQRFEKSTKHRADDLCVNLVWEYFCWMLGDPHFFFGRSLPFLTLFIILKNKKNLCVGSFNYFSYTIKKRVKLVHGYRST